MNPECDHLLLAISEEHNTPAGITNSCRPALYCPLGPIIQGCQVSGTGLHLISFVEVIILGKIRD